MSTHDSEFLFVPADGGVQLLMDGVSHSWVDPDDPWHLEFSYMRWIADVLDTAWDEGERIRAIHVGGGALCLPRYVAATRPTSAQIVMEPYEALTEAVRRNLPLPPRSGIKVRALDGRTGIAGLSDEYAQVVITDAFFHACVPADLASQAYIDDVARVLTADGVAIHNLIDVHPFRWSRRVLAGLAATFPYMTLTAEAATLKGRRHGNLVVAASRRPLPARDIVRRAAGAAFPARVVHGPALARFIGAATPFTDDDSEPSPTIERGPLYFS